MRICDWSSDWCSSDLAATAIAIPSDIDQTHDIVVARQLLKRRTFSRERLHHDILLESILVEDFDRDPCGAVCHVDRSQDHAHIALIGPPALLPRAAFAHYPHTPPPAPHPSRKRAVWGK